MNEATRKSMRCTALLSATLLSIPLTGLMVSGCASRYETLQVLHVRVGRLVALYQMPDLDVGDEISGQTGEVLFAEYNAFALTLCEDTRTELLASPLSYAEIVDHPEIGFGGYEMVQYVIYDGRVGNVLRFRRSVHEDQGSDRQDLQLDPIVVEMAETVRVGSVILSDIQADAAGFSARVSAIEPIFVHPSTVY